MSDLIRVIHLMGVQEHLGPGVSAEFVRGLDDRFQAVIAAGDRVLFKQWGEWAPNGFWREDTGKPSPSPREHTFPDGGRNGFLPLMARVGKKAAGRELDGRTWDQFPEVS